MDENFLRRVAAKIRQLAGKGAVMSWQKDDAYDYAMEHGLLAYNEWISGHFVITRNGHSFLEEYGN
jgi:hypothetical protein